MKNATRIVAVTAALWVCGSAVQADFFGTGVNRFTIVFVPISGATNPVSGYGIVNNDYRIGASEITNEIWSKFKAEYGTVTGTPSNAYDDEYTSWAGPKQPANKVSWYEAAQFVNYLNTSEGYQAAYKFTGTQGTGDYTLATWSAAEADKGTNLYRNKWAKYFLPTEDEWVKAAYWNGTSLQSYATADGSTPVAQEDSNYDQIFPIFGPWNVCSYGSRELNGTFDMMGNVEEWMESPWDDPNYGTGSLRAVRGGCFADWVGMLRSGWRRDIDPSCESACLGFRVASIIPEPCSLVLLALGGLAVLRRR